jgi:predicted  nucleic acid-binding Zn-ribbon protein
LLMSKERLQEIKKYYSSVTTLEFGKDIQWLISEVEQANKDNKELAELNQFLDNRIHEQHEEYKQLQQKVERLEKALRTISDKSEVLNTAYNCSLVAKKTLETEGKE